MSRRGLDGLDDEALMRRVERGDVDALAVLHGRYARLVRSIARRIVTDPRAAEEVTQEVFWDVWRVPERFDPSRGPFVAWLRMVARYRAITLWRADRGGTRGRTFLLPEFDEGPDDGLDRLAPPGPGADAAVLAAVVAGIVHEALAELPATHREVLVLAYWGGLSVREIAALLDVPEGTVKTRTGAPTMTRPGSALLAPGAGISLPTRARRQGVLPAPAPWHPPRADLRGPV